MRIISNFRDYYDKVQWEGTDLTLVFHRVHDQVDRNTLHGRTDFNAFNIEHPDYDTWSSEDKEFKRIYIDFGHIIFAGKIYPFARVCKFKHNDEWYYNRYTVESHFKQADSVQFIYEYDQLEKIKQQYNYEKKKANGYRWFSNISKLTEENYFKQYEQFPDILLAKAIEFKKPIIAITKESFEFCPVLTQYQFFKKLDAWQAFQELSMFMGNLAAPDETPVKISDSDRLKQYGFNHWSFRKQSVPFIEKKK